MGNRDNTKDTKDKQQLDDHTIAINAGCSSVVYISSREQSTDQPPHNHDRHNAASEGCKRNEVGALEAINEEPIQTTAEPQSHPSDTTSTHLSSAWADVDLPVSIWTVRNFKPIKRKRPTPPQPAGESKNRSRDNENRRVKTNQEHPSKQLTPSPTHQLIFPVLQIVPKTNGPVTRESGQFNLNFNMPSDTTHNATIVRPTNQSSTTGPKQESHRPQPDSTIPSRPHPKSNESLDSPDSKHVIRKYHSQGNSLGTSSDNNMSRTMLQLYCGISQGWTTI
jgi:hypothetical protein